MKITAILIPTLCLVAVAGISLATGENTASPAVSTAKSVPEKQYESFGNTQIVNIEPVTMMSNYIPFMFNHIPHVVTAKLSCEACHPNTFVQEQGSARAKGDYNHESFDVGLYCGTCHNGKPFINTNSTEPVFDTIAPDSCKRCHGNDMIQPDIVVFNQPVKGVLFDHKEHVAIGLDCASCHSKDFEMRVGAAEENMGKFNMRAIYAGKYCGVCHEGTIAYEASTRCTSCHIGVKGLKKMANQAALDDKLEN